MPDSSHLASYARLLRLTPVQEVQEIAPDIAPQIQASLPTPLPKRGIVSFLILAVLPTCVAMGYFWLVAAPRYESEARFILRSTSQTLAAPQVNSLVQSIGISRANDDGYVVREFLESRDALDILEKRADLRKAISRGGSDLFWRFPGLFASESNEGLYKYFKRIVSASFDSTTGVSTLRVQAFAPEEAYRLSSTLIEAAEELVNRLNNRARRDAVGNAESEADRLRQRALSAQSAITAFREREQLVDPAQLTLAVVEAIGKLGLEAANLSVQINELSSGSANAPQIAPLRGRRAAIEAQIVAERQRLAGDAKSIAPRIAEYERLMLERGFAEKALFSAMAAVEMARHEAARQQIYLERVAASSRPDYPAYPWRTVWCLVTMLIGFVVWRIWRILSADALEHVEQ